jgi:hypothetical protein
LLLKQEEKIVIEKEKVTMKKWREDFMIFTIDTSGMDPPSEGGAQVLPRHDLARDHRSNGRDISITGGNGVSNCVCDSITFGFSEYSCDGYSVGERSWF